MLPETAPYTEKRVAVLAARARQAFLEQYPVTMARSADARIYRSVPVGPLVEVFALDMRSFRGANNNESETVAHGASVMSLVAASPALNDPVLMGLARDYLAHVRSLPFVQSVLKTPDDDRGSNEFVISGQHSRTGRPILANDPHLMLTAPATFYQNEIRTPAFSAIGGSLPGVPFVIIGNTERFAWGVTTHRMDVTDVYQEKIVTDPHSPSGLSTLYQGKAEPVQALPQVFRANTVGDGVQNNVATVPPGGRSPRPC